MQRLEKMAEKPQRTSTKWTEFDELLGGGLARTEMLLLSANSGGGKSITLANLALNFLTQPKYPGCKDKMDVLYISLELSEEMIAQRFDTMYTGISSVIWQQNYKEIATAIETLTPHMGRLTIKRMPVGTNCNIIRAYLKEFELKNGYVPDMLIVDYLDIMGANEHVSADNVFEKDKRAAEQLRDVGFDYNMFVATASQQNRTAVTAPEVNHSHIAGGISKINTVDWYVSIIMNATMKAAGEIGFSFLKTRSSDGVGKQIFLRWDNTCLRIFNHKKDENTDDDGVITAKIALHKTTTVKREFTDLFDTDS
jgi:replicative DNA helicase